ncbi:MAG: peptide deformylase [Planctomycetia bacterium]|nr:peptide deformylase [Planctomycetia bacterium]
MPVRSILQLGNPLLLEKSQPVHDCTSAIIQQIIEDLRDTLAHFRQMHGYGRGIAAVQIGELQRIIYIRMQPTGFCGALINPVITYASSETITLWDDCFSFPDLLVQVKRATRITVAYLDEAGQAQTLQAEDDLSELLQHEIDHLDGTLAILRAISPSAFATREEWQRRYQPIDNV